MLAALFVQPVRMRTAANTVELALMHAMEADSGFADCGAMSNQLVCKAVCKQSCCAACKDADSSQQIEVALMLVITRKHKGLQARSLFII